MCQTTSFINNTYVAGIIGGVIASFLFIGILELFKRSKRVLTKRKFKRIFGSEEEKISLILPVFRVRDDIINFLKGKNIQTPEFPLIKSDGSFVRSSKLIANCDTKSLKYTSDLISNMLDYKPNLIIDEDLSNDLDLSFISFGGTNFYCSAVLNDENNNYYNIIGDTIKNKRNGNSFQIDEKYDYGLILKYKHVNFPKRTWIIVAGLGESGTSGAGWYLSAFWKDLSDKFKTKEFGVVIKVEHGIDKTAKIVDSIN